MLKRGTTKDVAVLTHDSIIAYRESLLKDINLKIRIAVDDKTYVTKLSEWENDTLIRKQQRQFFRLDTSLDATYQLLLEDMTTPPVNSPHYKGTIVNISVGGVCLVIDACLKANTLLYVSFDFLETRLSLVGRVLFDGERTLSGAYSHRVKFVNLSSSDENTLNRLIMTKQRLMRKGLNA